MHDNTSASLLERVRDHDDAASWQRFVDLYSPLLHYWLRRHHVLPQDADDLVQEVLAVVARKLPEFRYDREQGRFRGWLRGIVSNVLRNFWRAQRLLPTATGDSDFLASLDQLEDPTSNLARA